MRLSSFVVAAVVATAAPVLAAPAQARTWLPAQTLTPAGGSRAVLPLSDGVLGVLPDPSGTDGLLTATSLAGAPFGPAQPLPAPTAPVADASGALQLVSIDPQTGALRLFRRGAGTADWGAPVTAAKPDLPGWGSDLRLALSPGGTAAVGSALVSWRGSEASSTLRVLLRHGDGPLEPATTLYDGPGDLRLQDVVVDDLDHVAITFIVGDTAYVSFREADGTWRDPQVLGSTANRLGIYRALRVAMDVSGRAVVVWGQGGPGAVSTPLVAAFRTPGQPLGPPQPLGVSQVDADDVGLAVSAAGEAILLVHPVEPAQLNQLRAPAVLSGSTAAGRFAAPEPLLPESLAARTTRRLSLAMNQRGDAVVVYAPSTLATPFVARRRAPYAAFSPEEPIATPRDPSPGADAAGDLGPVAVGSDGQAAVAWTQPRRPFGAGEVEVSQDAGELPPAGPPSEEPVSLVPAAASVPQAPARAPAARPRLTVQRVPAPRGMPRATLRLVCPGPCFVVLSGTLSQGRRTWKLRRQTLALVTSGAASVRLVFPKAALTAMRPRKHGGLRPFDIRSDARIFDAAGVEQQTHAGGSFRRR